MSIAAYRVAAEQKELSSNLTVGYIDAVAVGARGHGSTNRSLGKSRPFEENRKGSGFTGQERVTELSRCAILHARELWLGASISSWLTATQFEGERSHGFVG